MGGASPFSAALSRFSNNRSFSVTIFGLTLGSRVGDVCRVVTPPGMEGTGAGVNAAVLGLGEGALDEGRGAGGAALDGCILGLGGVYGGVGLAGLDGELNALGVGGLPNGRFKMLPPSQIVAPAATSGGIHPVGSPLLGRASLSNGKTASKNHPSKLPCEW